MSQLFLICCALSVGLFIGFGGGAVKMATRSRASRPYTPEQVERTARLLRSGGAVLKYVTLLFLALGFVWCAYYLVLGAVDPGQAEYATAMSQLIVSVLTIVSIGFAFFEFLRSSRQREGAQAMEGPRATAQAAEAAADTMGGTDAASGAADAEHAAEAEGGVAR